MKSMKTQKFKRPLAWASLIGLLSVTNLTAQDGKLTEDEAFFYEEVDEGADVYDPFESVNRFTFEFNDFVFSNTIQPLVDAFRDLYDVFTCIKCGGLLHIISGGPKPEAVRCNCPQVNWNLVAKSKIK